MSDREKTLEKLLTRWNDYATSEIRKVNDDWINDLLAQTAEALSQAEPTSKKDEKSSGGVKDLA